MGCSSVETIWHVTPATHAQVFENSIGMLVLSDIPSLVMCYIRETSMFTQDDTQYI